MKDLEGIPDRTTDLCGAEKEPLPPVAEHSCDMCNAPTDELEHVSGVGLVCAACWAAEFEPSEQPLQPWW